MYRLLRILGLLAVAAAGTNAQDLAVQYRNTVSLPTQSIDQLGTAFTVTGLSGLSFAGGDRWWACMDNSNKLVELQITLSAHGDVSQVAVVRGLSLTSQADAEDLVVAGTHAWVADESPRLRWVNLATGQVELVLSPPAPFASVRPNFGFESLTAEPSGVHWTANEEALSVDGPLSTPQAGTLVRLLQLVPNGGSLVPGAQFAYLTAPVHGPTTSQARSGVSALAALPSGRMLALERSFAFNFASFFQSRIYELDFAAASQVQGLASLTTPTPIPPVVPIQKHLLYQAFHANMEGLALGPALTSGGFALLGIVDDGDPLSTNQLVAFKLTGPVAALCPADLDADGDADSDDIIAFFGGWDSGDAIGDFDKDGDTDSDDVVGFFAAFDAGC